MNIVEDMDSGHLFEMANLVSEQTGIEGIIYISTADASPWARVMYSEKPGKSQPSFTVSVSDDPEVKASSVDDRVLKRMGPLVMAWVKINKDALLRFWSEGTEWTDPEVTAFKASLKRLPPDRKAVRDILGA